MLLVYVSRCIYIYLYICTHKQKYIRYIIYTQNIYMLNVEQQTTKKQEKMPLLTGLNGFLQLQAPWIEIFFKKSSSGRASSFQIDWFPMSLKAPPFFLSKEVASNWCSPKISRKFHEITYVHLMCFIYLLGGGNMEISRLFEPPGTSGTWDTHGALELARPRGEDRLGWTHLGVTSEILWIP